MSSNFKGTGGPPPTPATGNAGSRGKRTEYGLVEKVTVNGAVKEKKVTPFMLKPGGSVELVTLDAVECFDYSVDLHSRFKMNGSFNNHAVCIAKLDERGCPLCEALEERGKWFAVGTVLDGSEWKIPSGKRKDEIITHQRRLLLVNNRQLEGFKRLGTKLRGLRGEIFDVSREIDQKSARIGSQWIPTTKLTEAEMIEKYSKAAAQYGLSPEKYIQPFNYEEVLAPKSYEELTRIASMVTASKDDGAAIAGDEASTDEVPF